MLNRRSFFRATAGALIAAPAVAAAVPSQPAKRLETSLKLTLSGSSGFPVEIQTFRKMEDAMFEPWQGVIWVTYGDSDPFAYERRVELAASTQRTPSAIVRSWEWEGVTQVEMVVRNEHPGIPGPNICYFGRSVSVIRRSSRFAIVRDPESIPGQDIEGDAVALLQASTRGYEDGKVIVFAKGAPQAGLDFCRHITLPAA